MTSTILHQFGVIIRITKEDFQIDVCQMALSANQIPYKARSSVPGRPWPIKKLAHSINLKTLLSLKNSFGVFSHVHHSLRDSGPRNPDFDSSK